MPRLRLLATSILATSILATSILATSILATFTLATSILATSILATSTLTRYVVDAEDVFPIIYNILFVVINSYYILRWLVTREALLNALEWSEVPPHPLSMPPWGTPL